MSNMRLSFFAPNLTPFVQPCDAGIIQAFKAIYRRKTILRTVDKLYNLDVDKDIFKIDQLTAMHLAKTSWYEVTANTIAHCWSHTGIITDTGDTNTDNTDNVADEMVKLQAEMNQLSIKAMEIGRAENVR